MGNTNGFIRSNRDVQLDGDAQEEAGELASLRCPDCGYHGPFCKCYDDELRSDAARDEPCQS